MIAPLDEADDSSNSSEEGGAENYFVSPDGLLALTIVHDIDGEQLLGFHGFDWQVQISVLAEVTGLPAEQAKQEFIDDILSDKLLIAVLYQHNELGDIWVTDDPEMDKSFLKPNEKLEFRYWSGRAAKP
ncbi:MAG: hypothetical protein AAF483_21465 [Planctomycetota bacterium]